MQNPREQWRIDPELPAAAVDWKGLLGNNEQCFLTDNQLSVFVDPKGPGCQRIHYYPLPFAHEFSQSKWDFAELVNHDCLQSSGPALDLAADETSLSFLPNLIVKRMRVGAATVLERCAVSGNVMVCTWDVPGIETLALSFSLPFFAAESRKEKDGVVAAVKGRAFVALCLTGGDLEASVASDPWSCRFSIRPRGPRRPVVLGLSCGYERETVLQAARAASRDPLSVIAQAERTWNEWFTRVVPFFSCSDRSIEKLYYYQAYVTRANLYDIPEAPFSHPYTCPWKTGAVWHWSWNTPMDSIAERWLNDKAIGAGGNLLMLDNGGGLNIGTYLHPLREIQELRGHNEHMAFVGRCRQAMPKDADLPVLTTIPHTTPNGLLGAWELVLCSADRDLMASMLRLMRNAEREFSRHELPTGLSTCSFIDEFDYSLRLKPFIKGFRKGDPEMMLKMDSPFIAIDYNSYLLALRERIVEAAESLGDSSVDVADLTRKNEALRKAINERLWDEVTGFYYDMDPRTMERSSVKCIAGFSPLYAGIASHGQAERLVAHLTNPAEFGTPYPFPSVSMDTPEVDPSLITYGGDVLITSGLWFTVEGLVRYGYRELAAKSLLKAIEMVTRDGPSSSYSYHSITGNCNQGKHTLAAQSVILTDLLCKYLVGIVPGRHGRLGVDPLALAASGVESLAFGPYRYGKKSVSVRWSRSEGYQLVVR